jgi:hypothetical protein
MSMWLVPMDLPAITIHGLQKVGWHNPDFNEVFDTSRSSRPCSSGRRKRLPSAVHGHIADTVRAGPVARLNRLSSGCADYPAA